jgi:parallel beta-helix repeat protein
LGCAGVALLGGLAGPSTALSAPVAGTVRYVAVTGNDNNNCSSTQPCRTIGRAITRSHAGDSIVVRPGVYLESLTITGNITITGQGGPARTIIDPGTNGTASGSAANFDRVWSAITVRPTGRVSLSGLTLRHGRLANYGLTTLIDSIITGSSHSGIYNPGRLTVAHSVLVANSGAPDGGGIYNTGTLTLKNSVIRGNIGAQGGGIFMSWSRPVSITNSTVSGNQASLNGGGIYVGYESSLSLLNSTVAGNTAVAGAGGGIVGYSGKADSAVAKIAVASSTVADNQATQGGGLVGYDFEPTIKSSILAHNHAGSGPDCYGTLQSGGYNVLGNTANCGLFNGDGSDRVGTPAAPLDPHLGPLQDNGGFAPTLALQAGSPAINTVPRADCTDMEGRPLTTDQRGTPRPDRSSGRCDSGAVEL